MSSDFFDDAAKQEAPEPPKMSFETIPDAVNVIVRTTTRDDKDTVHPKIKPFARKDGEGDFYIAKFPMVVVGGESKVDPKFVGKYFFTDFNVEKPSLAQLERWLENAQTDGNKNRLRGQIKSHSKYPCAPELYNLILDTLAPEGANAAERYPVALAKLKEKATALGQTPETFGGNTQLFIASVFKEILLDQSFSVIGRTYTPKQKEGSQYTPQQTIGSIGCDTEAERKKRKVATIAKPVIDDDVEPF